jgi:hypothetical protein
VIGIPRSIKKATSTPDVAFFVSGAKYRSQTPLREKVKLAAFIDRGVYFTLARTWYLVLPASLLAVSSFRKSHRRASSPAKRRNALTLFCS